MFVYPGRRPVRRHDLLVKDAARLVLEIERAAVLAQLLARLIGGIGQHRVEPAFVIKLLAGVVGGGRDDILPGAALNVALGVPKIRHEQSRCRVTP